MQFQFWINTPAAAAPDTTPELLASLRRSELRYRSPAPDPLRAKVELHAVLIPSATSSVDAELLSFLRRPALRHRLLARAPRKPATKLNVVLVPSAVVAPELPVSVLTRKKAARVLAERPFRVIATYSDLYFIENPDIWTIMVLHRRHPIPLVPPPRIVRRLDVNLLGAPVPQIDDAILTAHRRISPFVPTAIVRRPSTKLHVVLIPSATSSVDAELLVVQSRRIPPFVTDEPRRPSTKLPDVLITSAVDSTVAELLDTVHRRIKPFVAAQRRRTSTKLPIVLVPSAPSSVDAELLAVQRKPRRRQEKVGRQQTKLPVALVPSFAPAPAFPDGLIRSLRRRRIPPKPTPVLRYVIDLIKTNVFQDPSPTIEAIITMHRITRWKRLPILPPFERQKRFVTVEGELNAETLAVQHRIKIIKRWFLPVGRQQQKLPVSLIPSATSSVDAELLLTQNKKPRRWWRPVARQLTKLPVELIPSAVDSTAAELLVTVHRRIKPFIPLAIPRRPSTKLPVVLIPSATSSVDAELLAVQHRRIPPIIEAVGRTGTRMPVVLIPAPAPEFPASLLRRPRVVVPPDRRRRMTDDLLEVLIPAPAVPDSVLVAHRRIKPFATSEPRRPSTKLPIVLVPSAPSVPIPDAVLVAHKAPHRFHVKQGRKQTLSWRPYYPAPEIVYTENGGIFLFEWRNWGRTRWFHEVYMRATSGTAHARITIAGGASIDLSEIGVTSATFVRLRSVAFSLVDGTEYRAEFGTVAGDAGEVISSKLIAVESLTDNPNRSVAFPRERHVQLVLENAITI